MKSAVLAFVMIATVLSFGVDNDIAILGMVQMTQDSAGFLQGYPYTQSSPISPGFSAEFRHWWANEGRWHDHGLVVSYAFADTGAGFKNPALTFKFGLQRHIFDVGYVLRFHSDSLISPYLAIGAGGIITDGNATGIDGQFDAMSEAGADARLGRHLGMRYGVAGHWFRAPNFSDITYHASRTVMLEPRVGVAWTF